MPAAPRPYVDLKRRFRDYETTADPLAAAVLSYTEAVEHRLNKLDWAALMKRRRVIILAEQGSGKTREMKEQASRIRSEGQTAYFLRLDRLVAGDLVDLLGPELNADFQRWLNGHREAAFFLDSVDEAKIRSPADFHVAVGRFARALGSTGLARARIYLSSRFSAWRHESDFPDVASALGNPVARQVQAGTEGKEKEANADELTVVRLEPFDQQQALAFARAIGTRNPEGFIEEIGRTFAWEFARRPLDVIDLARFWDENGRLGTLTQIVDAHVRRNLRENPEREEDRATPLSEADARAGAKALAAATILCQKAAFDFAHEGDSLDPAAILPADWTKNRIEVLLARPVFDDASYGKRQFHHRRATEFLAAEWIADRMNEGCPLRTLHRLFFAEGSEGPILRPSLDPIAAWLCGTNEHWSPQVRAWVLRARPEIHLRYGDPAALPLDYRRAALCGIAAEYADRGHAWIQADDQALVRFAQEDLAGEVAHLFTDPATVHDFRWHLLHMAALSKLAGCVQAARNLFCDPSEPDDLRTEAVDVVARAGGDIQMQELAALARGLPVFGETLGYTVASTLYPRFLSNQDIVELATKVADAEMSIFPAMLGRHLSENMPGTQAGDLLRRFLDLVQLEPHLLADRHSLPLSQEFSHLRATLPSIVQVLLNTAGLSVQDARVAAEALLIIGDRAHDLRVEEKDDLVTAAKRHPAMRQHYFLRCIALAEASTGRPVTQWHFYPFHREALLQPIAADLDWLVDELQSDSNSGLRETLLSLTVDLWAKVGKPHAALRRIKMAIRNDAGLRQKLSRLIFDVRRAPYYSWWLRNVWFRIGQSYWWQERWRKVQDLVERARSLYFLHWSIRELSSGTNPVLLCKVLDHAGERSRDHWTITGWTELARKLGPFVKWGVRTGCRRRWRGHTPCAPSAKPEPNRTSYEVILGLNGIQVELEEPGFTFDRFTATDARTATYYAVNELNAPPDWLNRLAIAHPEAVSAALIECITHEWSMAPDQIRVYGVLSRVLGRADVLGPLARPGVLQLLQNGDPTQPMLLDFALRLLAPARPVGFGALAADRARSLPVDSAAAGLWTVAWLQSDPESALAWLESFSQSDVGADRVILNLCACLHGGKSMRPVHDLDAAYMRPPLLKRLIALIYRRVRLAEDVRRIGSYTPNGRDFAQEFRNGLTSAMADQRGDEITALLTELAEDPFLKPIRDSILMRRDNQMRGQNEVPAWRAADIREFTVANEAAPRTDADLFGITLKRLDDLKYAVELSDLSIRARLTPADDEYALRHFTAVELESRARGRYSAPQEAEIDEEKRPDLRVINPAVDGPVCIEIKWAENWTLQELLDALENQLVGTYLRPHATHYGVFLLGMIARGGKTHWVNPAGGPQLNFRQVVEVISARAVVLQVQTPGIAGLEVVAVDFRPPSQWEA